VSFVVEPIPKTKQGLTIIQHSIKNKKEAFRVQPSGGVMVTLICFEEGTVIFILSGPVSLTGRGSLSE
jgi:hypothetical protein